MRKILPLSCLAGVFLLLAGIMPDTSAAAECRALLESCGWQTAGAFTEEAVTLPTKEDATWATYLAMQQENGFDMEPFAGRQVLRLSCRIGNHPAGDAVYANLYWCDGRVIGGDIMSPALDGFMHGLKNSSF